MMQVPMRNSFFLGYCPNDSPDSYINIKFLSSLLSEGFCPRKQYNAKRNSRLCRNSIHFFIFKRSVGKLTLRDIIFKCSGERCYLIPYYLHWRNKPHMHVLWLCNNSPIQMCLQLKSILVSKINTALCKFLLWNEIKGGVIKQPSSITHKINTS